MKDVEIKGYRFRITPDVTDDGRAMLQLHCPDGTVITNTYKHVNAAWCMRLRVFNRIAAAKTVEEAQSAAETFGRPHGKPPKRKSYRLSLRIPAEVHDEYVRRAAVTGEKVNSVYRRVIESQVP